MEKKLEKKRFTKREDMLAALQAEIDRISATGEYDLFLHEMSNDKYFAGDSRRIEATERIANKILTQGLDLDLYGSILGTSRGFGNIGKVNPETICDYTYPCCNNSAMRAVAIIAIPKYIKVGNTTFEYSLCSRLDETQKLVDKAGLYPKRHHYCSGLFDCIKDRWPLRDAEGNVLEGRVSSYLPSVYLVGVEEIIEEDSDYRLLLPHTHISEIDKESKEKHLQDAAMLIKKLVQRYGTTNVPELIYHKIRDDYQRWVERENEYD
ncbi:MAG: hypothetical protein J6A28_03335 [Clostridia bacterium]|nr:hypothetical protein [Clostridia bacterium]